MGDWLEKATPRWFLVGVGILLGTFSAWRAAAWVGGVEKHVETAEPRLARGETRLDNLERAIERLLQVVEKQREDQLIHFKEEAERNGDRILAKLFEDRLKQLESEKKTP